MVADAADRYLARIAAHLHVGDAVRRSPTELRALYETAAARSAPLPTSSAGTASATASAPPSSPASAVPARCPIRPSGTRSNGIARGPRPR
jgi:hypothetical protein